MADATLQSLLSTKAALDLGLISQVGVWLTGLKGVAHVSACRTRQCRCHCCGPPSAHMGAHPAPMCLSLQADFDAVKSAFLRAQQIKAALDVGLIKVGSSHGACASNTWALRLRWPARGCVEPVGSSHSRDPRCVVLRQRRLAAARAAFRATSPSITHALPSLLLQPEDYEETKREFLGSLAGGAAVASAGGSNGAAAAPAAKPPQPPPKPVSWSIPPPAPPREQLQQQAAAAAPPTAAPQQAAPAPAPALPAAAPPTAAAAAAAMAAPAAAPTRPPMHRVPSNPDVPTNIPKMGGIKQLSQGVSTSGAMRARVCAALPVDGSVSLWLWGGATTG